jgi:hypothetical protein
VIKFAPLMEVLKQIGLEELEHLVMTESTELDMAWKDRKNGC